MLICLLFCRLCDAKKSKVFLPEHPFPHSEVTHTHTHTHTKTHARTHTHTHAHTHTNTHTHTCTHTYYTCMYTHTHTLVICLTISIPVPSSVHSLLRVVDWSISQTSTVTLDQCTRPPVLCLPDTPHWGVVMRYTSWRHGEIPLRIVSSSQVVIGVTLIVKQGSQHDTGSCVQLEVKSIKMYRRTVNTLNSPLRHAVNRALYTIMCWSLYRYLAEPDFEYLHALAPYQPISMKVSLRTCEIISTEY